MFRRFLVCGLVLSMSVAARAEEPKGDFKLPTPPTNAHFEKLKKLAGTWVVADKDGKPTDQISSIIKVTAGGSAIHETSFPGTPMEMISVYTVEGDGVIMTHYCVLGNQPKCKSDPKSPNGQIVFDFVSGGNLDVKKDKHMHGAIITFVDDDHYKIDGIGWDNGGPVKDMCCGMSFVRKK